MNSPFFILNPGVPDDSRNYLKVRFSLIGRATLVVWDLRKTGFTPDEVAEIMTEQAALELHCEPRQLNVVYVWTTKT